MSESPYRFEQLEGYSAITLLPQLNDSQWADIERVGTDVVERLKTSDNPKFIVDLSRLNYMGSAMVALIVRLWKSVKDSKKGRMVVVNQHDMVFEVLKLAGLHNVWTIVDTRDEAVKSLGISLRSSSRSGAATRPASDSGVLWTVVGIISVVGAAAGLTLLLTHSRLVTDRMAQLVVVVFAALGLIMGMISAVRETDWRQKVGIGVVVASVILVVAGILTAPPGAPAAKSAVLDGTVLQQQSSAQKQAAGNR